MDENENPLYALVKDLVEPVCKVFESLKSYEKKEELVYFTLPLVLLAVAARKGVDSWLKVNAIMSIVFGLIMIVCPQAILSITVFYAYYLYI